MYRCVQISLHELRSGESTWLMHNLFKASVFLAKRFLNSFAYVMGMVRNKVKKTTYVQFNILHDISDENSQEFSILCMTNSHKYRSFFY